MVRADSQRTEAAMLEPIFRVMEGSYGSSHKFASLGNVCCPVLLGSCAESEPVYAPIKLAAQRLLPDCSAIRFSTGHCTAQIAPDAFAAVVRELVGM
jgi:pimeloyl-ACP methyl ester carboxylesterase